MTDQVHVALLNEGVDVWRPVPVRRADDGSYSILRPDDYDPADETWQFPPGSQVVCEPRVTAGGTILAAVRLRDATPETISA